MGPKLWLWFGALMWLITGIWLAQMFSEGSTATEIVLFVFSAAVAIGLTERAQRAVVTAAANPDQ